MPRYLWSPPVGVSREFQCSWCSGKNERTTYTRHEYREQRSWLTAARWWECSACGHRIPDDVELLNLRTSLSTSLTTRSDLPDITGKKP
jgi:DNA-directed RNA polymerase subunit RPC12/RpoP